MSITLIKSIVVVKDNCRYIHKCSDDLLFGILIVVGSSDKFIFYLEGSEVPITLEDIKYKYDINKGFKKYTAITKICNITFDTKDVIQGINTGASWLNVDPHQYIKDIRENHMKVRF